MTMDGPTTGILEGFALAPQQRRLWTRRPGTRFSQAAIYLEDTDAGAALDTEALAASLDRLVERHEVLRTSYRALAGMDLPIQVIGPPRAGVLRRLEGEGTLDELLAAELDAAAAEGEPLEARFSLGRLAGGGSVLVLTLPALSLDELSLENLLGELTATYAEAVAGSPGELEEPVQYSQFSEWQNELFEDEDGEEGRAFWSERPFAEELELRLPGTGSGEPSAERAAHEVHRRIDAELAARIRALVTARGVSAEAFFLAAWQVLLARLAERTELAVAVARDGRPYEEMHEALGLYARWPLVSFSGQGRFAFGETLLATASGLAAAGEWQEYFAWSLIGENLPAPFTFAWREPIEARTAAGVRFALERAALETEPFQAELTVLGAEPPEIVLRSAPEVFSAEAVGRLAERYLALVAAAAAEPETRLSDLDWLGAAERAQLAAWNATEAELPAAESWSELLAEQAARTPDAVAVGCGEAQLSFGELERRALALAGKLRRHGVGPEVPVILALDRSLELIVGLRAVLAAGGAFVPVDPAQPKRRLELILADSGARVALADAGSAELLAEDVETVLTVAEGASGDAPEPLGWPPAPGQGLAYAIYTSGSTGRPKAVLIGQRSLVHLASALEWAIYRGETGVAVSLNAPLSFDAAIKQVVQLGHGRRLEIVPEAIRPDGEAMLEYLERRRVDVLDCTPSQLRLLLAAGLANANATAPRRLLIGGEAIASALWAELAELPRREAWNVYGPTECTVDTTVERVAGERPVVGRPLANVRLHVIDRRVRPVPLEVAGELAIAGAGLARGYRGAPALTAERFIPDPFAARPGERLYRSGDRMRLLPDGRAEFLGRWDDQVKIRGVRIELGELTSILAGHPGVHAAAVVVREHEGEPRLVGYAVPRFARAAAGPERHRLPNGMVIAHQNRNESEYLYEEIFRKRCYDQHGIVLGDRPVVLDVGANIGMFTLFVSAHRPGARIYAFEPLEPIYRDLERNSAAYGADVRLFRFGLSDRPHRERFTYYPRYSMMSGQESYSDPGSEIEVIKRFLANEERLQEAGGGELGAAALLEQVDELLAGRFQAVEEEVELRPLSAVIREQGITRVDLLKIDVQRAELDVLEGLEEEHWPLVDQIVMEVHDQSGEATSGRVPLLQRRLEERGFEVVVEQDELLVGTDRYNLYARRSGRALAGWPIAEGEPAVVADAGSELGEDELREYLRERLPAQVNLTALVLLDSLPLTPSGKVDRRALPAPEEVETRGRGELEAPASPFEEMLAEIWSDLLGIERVGRNDDFFALGGHSLLATQLMARVRETCRAEVPLRALFEASTLHELAARIEAALGSAPPPPIAALERGAEGLPLEPVPLSFAQQRLWFLQRLDPESSAYNSAKAVLIRGRLDPAALERALAEIVRRHEVLRTRFPEIGGEPRQVVAVAGSGELARPLPCVDLSALEAADRRARARELAGRGARRPFDLERDLPLRSALFSLGDEEHVFTLVMHHLVSDGWSMGILIHELGTLYDAFAHGRPSPLDELPCQYADFAVWQRGWLEGEVLEDQLAWWRRELRGLPPRLELPTDRPRPPIARHRGALLPFRLAAEPSAALAALGRERGATLFMVLLAAYQTLLGRLCGQRDLAVGSPIAGRRQLEVEPLIGFFVNSLVLRADLSGDPPWCELLESARERTLGAFAHQDLPFERLVEELAPERDASYPPLFQVALTLQNVPREAGASFGLELVALENEAPTAKFEWTLALEESGEGLRGVWEYDADLYDRVTLERLGGQFARLLEEIVADPGRRLSRLPLQSRAERLETLAVEPSASFETEPLDLAFARWAATAPDAVALVTPGAALSYGELQRRAGELAGRLAALGVGAETVVALYLERGAEMVEAILATLAAGGVYLPLDPAWPRERLEWILEDSGARVVVSRGALVRELPEVAGMVSLDLDHPPSERSALRPRPLVPGAGAYVIYTSGSTGKPKGVVVGHGNAARLFTATRGLFDFSAEDVWTLFHSFAFDFSVWEMWGALAHGGRVVIVPWAVSRSPESFRDLLAAERVSVVSQTPSAFRELQRRSLGSPAAPWALRWVIFGGEALAPASLGPWLERFGDRRPRLVNMYGITETTVHVTHRELAAADARSAPGSPIGEPIADLHLLLLDHALEPVAPGFAGEIAVGGAGLARGYLARPALTAERFVPDPAGGSGARLYLSGDLGRRRSNGELEYLGRRDHQTKIRGFRIELGEIEAALAEHPAVEAAVAMARPGPGGEPRLVAWVVSGGEAPKSFELREYLAGRLPAYMLPAAFVALDELPLTSNGKVDRRALPEPRGADLATGRDPAPPATPHEERLAALWRQLLGVETVSRGDDFFELGGHSLLAVRLLAQMRETFGIEVPLRTLFEAPTLAGLAAVAEGLVEVGEGSSRPPLARVERGVPLPLSFAQERLWFLDQLEPESALYNIPLTLRFGALDPHVLGRAMNELVRRHEVLRTHFEGVDARPIQVIEPPTPISVPVVELERLEPSHRGVETARLADREARRPFDLGAGPLWRTCLLRSGAAEHLLLATFHHTVADGWSLGVIEDELSALYDAFAAGRPSPLAELDVQYADYAVWQRRWLRGPVLAEEVEYWRDRLAGAPPLLELPTDRTRPAVQKHRGAKVPVRLGRDLSARLAEYAPGRGATPFMVLLAAFQAMLARLSGQDDVVVGAPVAGRNHRATEALVGLFVNTLVLRTSLRGAPHFESLLGRVRDVVIDAQAHGEIPFEKLVEELAPKRSLSHSPLFQVMLVLQNFGRRRQVASSSAELGGPVTRGENAAKFDLTLTLIEEAGGYAGALEYDLDLFDRTTVERWLGSFERLLGAALERPRHPLWHLPFSGPGERHQLLVEPDLGGHLELPRPLHEWVAEQAERSPEAIAVGSRDAHLSYAGLMARARALASDLETLGVGPEVRVGVCLERGSELVAAILGVLLAGGAYVPLDPSYPRERLDYMLEDSGAAVLVSAAGLEPRRARSVEVRRRATPQNLAYVIYTSGSTGRAKGVAIEHRSASALLAWSRRAFVAEELEGVLAATSICFDLSVFEIFVPLASGGRVILAENALALVDLPAAHRVRTINTVPSAIAELVALDAVPSSVRTVNLAGEPLQGTLVEKVYGAGSVGRVLNLYGPSEDTTYSTWVEVPETSGVEPSIGRPIEGTRARVLDRRGEPVPAGVVGELHLGGAGLARGYWDRPRLSAERWVPDAFSALPGERSYHTGDLVRWRPDGELEFLGRIDHQVKVRGFRIELGEIEAMLSGHPGVREVAVTVRDDTPVGRALVAWIAGTAAEGELRTFLRERLPGYMVPSLWRVFESLPVTPSGKIDRGALDRIAWVEREAERLGARTPVEEMVRGVWAEVLGRGELGMTENFFELGGHSLLATRVMSRLRAQLGIELPLRALFEAPTVAALARRCERALKAGERRVIPPLRRVERTGALPLSFAQERIWFLEQLEPGSALYNIPLTLRLDAVEPPVLERAVTELVRRHEILRTRFVTLEEGPVQRIEPAPAIRIPRIELEGLRPADRRREVERLALEEIHRPFELDGGPPWRLSLVRSEPTEHVVLATLHHIVTDGWSMVVLERDLKTIFEALLERRSSPLGDLPFQYADYAVWQREWLRGEVLTAELDHWRSRLEGAPSLIALPTDRPRPAVLSERGFNLGISIPTGLAQELGAFARERAATPFMVLLAAFQALLARLSGQRDVVVGTPVAGRGQLEVEEVIGLFVNTLVLRTDLSGSPGLGALVDRVRQVTLDAYSHQDLPFEKLVEELAPERSMGHTPIFQVMLVLQSFDREWAAGGGVSEGPSSAKFDLTMVLRETPRGFEGIFEYNVDLFDAATMRRWRRSLLALLSNALDQPSRSVWDVAILAESERQQLLYEWAEPPGVALVPSSLGEMVSASAERWPEAIAVVDGERQFSYGWLDRRAAGIAERLWRHGVAAEERIVVSLGRSAESLVSMLGVLGAGAVCVPVDPSYPESRKELVREDSGARIVLTETPSLAPATAGRAPSPDPRQLAFLLYASGSTGAPKGVMLSHGALSHYVHRAVESFELETGDRYPRFASSGFDASLEEIFCPLASGAAVVLRNQAMAGSAREMWTFCDLEKMSIAWLPTAYAPIGRPIAGVTARVLDGRMKPVAIGAIGELSIGGLGVARGYHARPAMTARSFVPDPQSRRSGERLYRTGDRVRHLCDGTLEFLDRKDDQVDHDALETLRTTAPGPVEEPPATVYEQRLAELWRTLLGRPEIGRHDVFFDLGGHSLLAVRLLVRIRETFQIDLPLRTLVEKPRLDTMALAIERASRQASPSSLVAIRPEGSRPPLHFVHPVGGTTFCYLALARELGAEQPVYAFEAMGVDGRTAPLESIEAMAERYLAELREHRQDGPWALAGWSLGGVVAYEMARRLEAEGEPPFFVALLDAAAPLGRPETEPDEIALLTGFARDLGIAPERLRTALAETGELGLEEALSRLLTFDLDAVLPFGGLDFERLQTLFEVYRTHVAALLAHRPGPYSGKLTLLRADRGRPDDPTLGWGELAEVDCHVVEGDHHSMLREPHVHALADLLAGELDRAWRSSRGSASSPRKPPKSQPTTR